jgi:PKD repeat protein
MYTSLLKNLIYCFIVITISFTSLKAQNISFTTDVSQGCNSLNVNFTNTSNLGSYDPLALRFIWYFGDGTQDTGLHANHFYSYAGDFFPFLSVEDTNGFYIGSFSSQIKVKGINFVSPWSGNSYCPNQTVHFEVGANYPLDSVLWNFGDGNTGQNIVDYTYADTGMYNYTAFVFGECGVDTMYGTISVYPGPIPFVFIMADALEGCVGDEITFSTFNPSAQHVWSFSNGSSSNASAPSVVLDSSNLEVTLALTVCGSTGYDTLIIQVKDSLFPNIFNYNISPQTTCPEENVFFNGYAVGQYTWNLGDGTVVTNDDFIYQYQDTGTYIVKLKIENGCGFSDSTSMPVQIQYNSFNTPFTNIQFDVDNSFMLDTLRICPGGTVGFINNSWANGSSSTQQWSFGDGTFSSMDEPSHTFDSAGFFAVSFMLTNNCGGTATATKYVFVDTTIQPMDNLSAIPFSICPNENVFFFVDGERENGNTYSIWFGDGDSLIGVPAENPALIVNVTDIHTYSDTGLFNYIFTATNACGNTKTQTGQIFVSDSNATPMYFVFAEADSGQACPGDLVPFFAAGGTSFVWNWGDGTPNDSIQNPMHAFDTVGYYQPSVTITNSCGQDSTITLDFYTGSNNFPNSWFFVNGFHHCAGDSVEFSPNNVRPGNVYTWNFGDGTTSNEVEPKHAYTAGGFYNVQLTVSNGCGASSSMNGVSIVNIGVHANDAQITPSSCVLNTGSITNIQVNDPSFNTPYAYAWYDANNSLISTTQNVFNLGVGTYTLVVTSNSGCMSPPVSFNVPSVSAPTPPTFNGSLSACLNDYFDFEIISDSGAMVTWYSDAALTDSIYGDSVWAFIANTANTFYVTQSVNGCESFPTTITTQVSPIYAVNNPQTICDGGFYIINGNTYTMAGTYVDTFFTANNCDSVVTTVLSVNQVYAVNNPQTICDGGFYIINGNTYTTAGTYVDTFFTANNCDSVVTTVLSVNQVYAVNNPQTICDGGFYIINGNTYTMAGTYVDTFFTANNCDSVVTTLLTVNPSYLINNSANICNGGIIIIGGNMYSVAGTYVDSFLTSSGCDSILITELTVYTIDTNVSVVSETATAAMSGATYQWVYCDSAYTPISGETNQSYTATSDGNYAVIISSNGCNEISGCHFIDVLSTDVGSLLDHLISVFPNPTSDVLNISYKQWNGPVSVSLTDIQGRNVYRQVFSKEQNIQIDLSQYSKGVYSLNVEINQEQATWNIVLQ